MVSIFKGNFLPYYPLLLLISDNSDLSGGDFNNSFVADITGNWRSMIFSGVNSVTVDRPGGEPDD